MRIVMLLLFALLALLPTAAGAYPTSINVLPTAETVSPSSLLFELGNAGYSSMLTTESESAVYTQFGIGSNFEVGWDRYEDEESNGAYWNGKLRLVDESDSKPGIAVGVMDIARHSAPTFYSVASKALGSVRAHLGYINGSYSHGIIAGADLDFAENYWLGVDYFPGDDNYLRFGFGRSLGEDSFVTLSIGAPNNNESKAEIGLTLSTFINFGK